MAKKPGKAAKTRLSGVLDEALRTKLAEAFLQDKASELGKLERRYAVAVAPPDAPESVRALVGERAELFAQAGAEFGERLLSALVQMFESGAPWVALVDADTPTLPRAYLDEASIHFDDGAEMVVGPAWDGGYYLIGFSKRALYTSLFSAMPWSTSAVFSTTCTRARDLGITPHVLPAWYDVDTPHDLARLADELRYADTTARGYPAATAAVLREAGVFEGT